MRNFTKVSPSLWRSRRFRHLPSDDARFLYVYFLTAPHQTSAGCYEMLDGYACADLGWTPDRYRAARAQLVVGDMILWDEQTDEVFILRWFAHNLPDNPSHRKAIERAISAINSPEIRVKAREALEISETSKETARAAASAQRTVSGALIENIRSRRRS